MKLLLENWRQHLEEESRAFPYQIYCDMDGVLVDFEKGAVEQINKDLKDESITGKSIDKLRQKLASMGRETITSQHLAKEDMEKRLKAARKYMYSRLQDDATYWADLDWNRGGKDLWSYISKYNPYILTTPMKDKASKIGKAMWIKENLTPVPEKVFMSDEKYKWATNEDGSPNILIDDFTTNTIPWEEHGGIAILHTSTEKTIKELEELMSEVEIVAEDFQQDVKKKHRKMKIRLIGKGKNKYNVGGKMKKPSFKRSKSSPVGFGGS